MGRTPATCGLLFPRMRATQALATDRDRSASWWRGDIVAMRQHHRGAIAGPPLLVSMATQPAAATRRV
jgi:hypothetical protein